MDVEVDALFEMADALGNLPRLNVTVVLHNPKDKTNQIYRSSRESSYECPYLSHPTSMKVDCSTSSNNVRISLSVGDAARRIQNLCQRAHELGALFGLQVVVITYTEGRYYTYRSSEDFGSRCPFLTDLSTNPMSMDFFSRHFESRMVHLSLLSNYPSLSAFESTHPPAPAPSSSEEGKIDEHAVQPPRRHSRVTTAGSITTDRAEALSHEDRRSTVPQATPVGWNPVNKPQTLSEGENRNMELNSPPNSSRRGSPTASAATDSQNCTTLSKSDEHLMRLKDAGLNWQQIVVHMRDLTGENKTRECYQMRWRRKRDLADSVPLQSASPHGAIINPASSPHIPATATADDCSLPKYPSLSFNPPEGKDFGRVVGELSKFLQRREGDSTCVYDAGASAARGSREDTIIVDVPVVRPQQASRNRRRKGKRGEIVKIRSPSPREDSRFKSSQFESQRTSTFGWISAKMEMVWRNLF